VYFGLQHEQPKGEETGHASNVMLNATLCAELALRGLAKRYTWMPRASKSSGR
jgi:hypothetical protein